MKKLDKIEDKAIKVGSSAMRDLKIVDVFSSSPFLGNPVAVVIGADGLTDEEMQRIAAWTNLSETTFHLKPTAPEADYRLRIFTPRSELPFAGHPTLGSAHALLEAGIIKSLHGRIVQECSKGLVPITVNGSGPDRVLHFQLPAATSRDLTDAEHDRLAAILGVPLKVGTKAAMIDVGARWIVAEMDSVEVLLHLKPDLQASATFEAELRATGVTLFVQRKDRPGYIEVRSFAPSCGVNEDPVCGSGNGSVAAYRLSRSETLGSSGYTATQGRCVGRDGQVFISYAGETIWVGGKAVTTASGTIAA